MKWAEHVGCVGGMRNVCTTFVRTPEGKILFGRPRRTGEDSIIVGPKEITWECMIGINLDQDRVQCRGLVSKVMNLVVP
jgi:hypothetical protein